MGGGRGKAGGVASWRGAGSSTEHILMRGPQGGPLVEAAGVPTASPGREKHQNCSH